MTPLPSAFDGLVIPTDHHRSKPVTCAHLGLAASTTTETASSGDLTMNAAPGHVSKNSTSAAVKALSLGGLLPSFTSRSTFTPLSAHSRSGIPPPTDARDLTAIPAALRASTTAAWFPSSLDALRILRLPLCYCGLDPLQTYLGIRPLFLVRPIVPRPFARSDLAPARAEPHVGVSAALEWLEAGVFAQRAFAAPVHDWRRNGVPVLEQDRNGGKPLLTFHCLAHRMEPLAIRQATQVLAVNVAQELQRDRLLIPRGKH